MKALINSKKRGWTLLELVIAVAAAAILAKVAYASYTDFQIRQNREVAKQELMKAATAMEKYYAQNGRYTTADGQWPSGLFGSEVVGSNGVVYTLQMGNGNPNTQDFKILAVPKAGTIQSDDGDICIDKAGKFVWPANGQCEIQPEVGDVPVPTTSPSITPSVAPSVAPTTSVAPSVVPSATPSSSPSSSPTVVPSPSPSPSPLPVPAPSPTIAIGASCGDGDTSGYNFIAGACANSFSCSHASIGGSCSGGGNWAGSCSGSCIGGACSGNCSYSNIGGSCAIGLCNNSRIGGDCNGYCANSIISGNCSGTCTNSVVSGSCSGECTGVRKR